MKNRRMREEYDEIGWNVKNKRTGQVFTTSGRTPMDAKKRVIATQPLLHGHSPIHDFTAYPMGTPDPDDPQARPTVPAGGREPPGATGSPRRFPRAKMQVMQQEPRASRSNPTSAYARPNAQRPSPDFSAQPRPAPRGATQTEPRAPVWMGDTDVDVPELPSVATHRARQRGMRGEGAGVAAMGANGPMGRDPKKEAFKEAVRQMVREIVRKKKGGGGYALYAPNKGKKKNPKPVGEFPTRLAAKKSELARFPPKDPEQLKKVRARLDRLSKDPKKRAEAEREDLTGKKRPRKSGAPARDRKKRKEEFVRLMARDLHERLFHEDEIPGSPWDEQMTSLHPDAISSDRKLHALHRGMEKASIGALGDAHKGLTRALRGIVKVQPGEVAFDSEKKKNFMPVMLDCDGFEIGPVHLYIDGGHVRIELSQDARQAIGQLEPDMARDLRGGLMSFEEDHLPTIDKAHRAWSERDAYLDKLHARLSKHAAGLSGVEHHILKGLLGKGGKRK